MERIYLKQEDINDLISHRRWIDHIERYLMVRRFVYGNVVDLGCGIGYGSRLLSENPDISKVVGFDICNETIEYAKSNFTNGKKLEFTDNKSYIKCLADSNPIDVLIAFELIEHIEDSEEFYKYIVQLDPNVVIVSFPNKPSLKYNKFHYHDYVKQDIVNIMKGYIGVKSIDVKDVTMIVFVKAPKNMPREVYHNFLDIWV